MSTPTPCYSEDVMYQDNIVLSITEIEKNRSLSVSSLRSNTDGITLTDTSEPTLRVELDYTLASRIISIAIPNQNNKTYVNQIQVTFFGEDNQVLRNARGEKWIVETMFGVTKVCSKLLKTRKIKQSSF